MIIYLHCFDAVGWAIERASGLENGVLIFWGDDLTRALHTLEFWLPRSLSLDT